MCVCIYPRISDIKDIYIYPLSIHLWVEDTSNSNETE